ncbi:MAG: GxxExxY protein [Fibromonadales bacterium]|nr:GxxExxY protein [Fibromonadales bacterium]
MSNCLNQNSQNLQDYQNKTGDGFTYRIIGCAMKVHSTLGNGFQEVIYQRCLAIELGRAGLEFEREKEQTIYYEDIAVGTRRADFVVENKVIVELKALTNLEDVHLSQAKNYLEAYNFPIGLLINFGSKNLEYKFIFNKKFNQKSQNKAKK